MADTEPSDVAPQPARDADMMVCMYSDGRLVMKSNNEHQEAVQHQRSRTLAQEAGVKQLVMAHMHPHLLQGHPH